MCRLVLSDIDTIMDIYYNKAVLATADIMRLFNCSRSTASKLKKEAQKAETAPRYSDAVVKTKDAFLLWGIDIIDIEKRYHKKQKLKKGG